MSRPLIVSRLGLVPYQEAWERQRELVERRKAGTCEDTLLLLEHPPVITLGREGKRDSLLHDEAALAERGVDLVQSDRGGDITYHGPGQIVGYPILDLRPDWQDVRRFVRALEQTMADTAALYGVETGRLEAHPGVWCLSPDRKLGAVGARISRWVTHHGFAFNVNTRLDDFGLIVPCGIQGKGVTSLERELGQPVPITDVMAQLATAMARIFGRELVFD